MELEKYDTMKAIQELLAIRNDIDLLGERPQDVISPKMDIFDLGDRYRLLIDVPGVSQENLELAVQGRTVTVAGFREPVEAGLEIVLSERPRGHFQRSVELPADVNPDASQANLREGLLIIDLPKLPGNS